MNTSRKTNNLFLAAMLIGLLFHLLVLFVPHFLFDETFYATIPYRLVQGDSLVRDEWHLSQFSSLFSYLPVRFWVTIKGSADGLIVFLRCLYLALHTGAAVLVYRFFKEYKYWAIIAAMMFYLQAPYKIYAISYNSMFALFLLLFTLCLLSVYEKSEAKKYHVFAGVCYGACCVNNPLFCAVFALYLLLCILWLSGDRLFSIMFAFQTRKAKRKSTSKKAARNLYQKASQKTAALSLRFENYNCFFTKNAILFFSLGIGIAAAISILFFFGTGGTLKSLAQNMDNLFRSSEYGFASFSFKTKLGQIWTAIDSISFHMPFLLPLLFLILFFDKKRTKALHRLTYIMATVLLSILYIGGMKYSLSSSFLFSALLLSLPLSLLSIICFILTEEKNTKLFFCMWCPCAVASFCNLIVSNSLFFSAGVMLAIGNIAGIVFVRDFWKELRSSSDTETIQPEKNVSNKKLIAANRAVICFGLILQFAFYGYVLQFGQLPSLNGTRATEGPFAGMWMSEQQYSEYETSIGDLNYIKAHSDENDPVLIVSFKNWVCLYLERSIATYTTWNQGNIQPDSLIAYYSVNPDKIPKYIYIVKKDVVEITGIDNDNIKNNMGILREMFNFTETPLSDGVLLTVTGCKFD